MSSNEIMEYIRENFEINGATGRLIENIVSHAERIDNRLHRYAFLLNLLGFTIGLTDAEIKMFVYGRG